MHSFEKAKHIVHLLQQANHEAYFAGGWVRDFLLGHPSDDIDIATSATPQEVQKLFPQNIPIGVAYGIILVLMDHEPFEIATFRKDLEYVDGRHPSKIEFTHPKEDALRRDFTINGMFYDPIKGKVLDFVKGQKDLENKIVRAIGNPHERFEEDRLRMVRAIRLACRFNFSIEDETAKAIKKHAKELFPAVAIERIWQELMKMSNYNHFDVALTKLFEFGLLQQIFPKLNTLSLQAIKKRTANIRQLSLDVPIIGKIMQLFEQLDLLQIKQLCEYLKLSKKDTQFALFLCEAQLNFKNNMQLNWENYDWAVFLAHPYAEWTLEIISLHLSVDHRKKLFKQIEELSKILAPSIERLKNKKKIISSERLKNEGIQEGTTLGFLLKESERLSANLTLNDAEKVLDLLKKSKLWPKDL